MAETKLNAELSNAILEAAAGQMVGTKWYLSKTFWANTVSGLLMIVQVKYGFIVPPEYQMLSLSMINMWLRKITNTPIVW